MAQTTYATMLLWLFWPHAHLLPNMIGDLIITKWGWWFDSWVGLTYILWAPPAGRPLLQLPTAQAGQWKNSNLSQPNPNVKLPAPPCQTGVSSAPTPGVGVNLTDLE